MDNFPTEVHSFEEVSAALRALKTALSKVLRPGGDVLTDDSDNGPVLKDRSNANYYRIVSTLGVLSTEAEATRP